MEFVKTIIAWFKEHSVTLDLQKTEGRNALLFQAGLDQLQTAIPLGELKKPFNKAGADLKFPFRMPSRKPKNDIAGGLSFLGIPAQAKPRI